ncbi:MAG TPA: response regulator [Gemmatimonadaceae bacterium]
MGAKILIIDDDPVNLGLLAYLLRAFSHEPLMALGGEEALQMAGAHIPDLILCDIQMPDMNGFEVLRRLRADPRFAFVPIVGVTALAMVGDREKILAAGFDGYLTKPIAPETFVAEIEKYLPPDRVSSVVLQIPVAGGTSPLPWTPATSSGYVLVVDDNLPNLDLLRHLITSLGMGMIGATNAEQGLRIARAKTPSLIISDLHMPGCNGVELLEIVRSDQELRRIPFVLISATGATADEQRRAFANGADGFLLRPLDPETILAHLTRWIPTES